MTPLEAFRKYVAIKVHFTSDKFDYTKSKGYTKNITENAYYKRSDKYYFEKISNRLPSSEIVPFFVANFIVDPNMWSGDLASFNKSLVIYKEWKARIQNLKMEVNEDLSNINKFLTDHNYSFDDIFEMKNGDTPLLIKMYYQQIIIPETIIYFDKAYTNFSLCDIITASNDCLDPLLKSEAKILYKYSRFLIKIDWSRIITQPNGETVKQEDDKIYEF